MRRDLINRVGAGRWKLVALAGAVAIACAGTVAAFALPSSDSGLGVKSATTPDGTRVPISRSIDGETLVYQGELGEASVFLADGAGPSTAGMKCVVLATQDITRTACDTPEAVEAGGLVLSEDVGPGQLKVSGYLPGGLEAISESPVATQGDFFEGTVPRDQRAVALKRAGAFVEIPVPGSP